MKRRISFLPKPLKEPKQVILQFMTHELLNDISTLCNVVGESHDTQDGASTTTLAKDVLAGENLDLIMRGIEKNMLEAWRLLFPYAKTPICHCCHDDNPTEIEVFLVTLTFDYDRDETQVQYLKTQIHEYVVKKVVFDWLVYSMVPGARVADVQAQQRKIFEDSEQAKNNIATALAEPLEIRSHHIRPQFF